MWEFDDVIDRRLFQEFDRAVALFRGRRQFRNDENRCERLLLKDFPGQREAIYGNKFCQNRV